MPQTLSTARDAVPVGRARAQPSRSRRPGRRSSHVRRRRSRRGCSGGSTVPACRASTTGPSSAPSRSVISLREVQFLARARCGERRARLEPGELARRGRRQDPRRHAPSEVELLGTGHRERQDRRHRCAARSSPSRCASGRAARPGRSPSPPASARRRRPRPGPPAPTRRAGRCRRRRATRAAARRAAGSGIRATSR